MTKSDLKIKFSNNFYAMMLNVVKTKEEFLNVCNIIFEDLKK